MSALHAVLDQRRVCRIATSGRSPIIAHSTNLGPGPVELAVEPAALEVVQAS